MDWAIDHHALGRFEIIVDGGLLFQVNFEVTSGDYLGFPEIFDMGVYLGVSLWKSLHAENTGRCGTV